MAAVLNRYTGIRFYDEYCSLAIIWKLQGGKVTPIHNLSIYNYTIQAYIFMRANTYNNHPYYDQTVVNMHDGLSISPD